MYENLTYERIMSRVLANVPSNVDKRQGSVIYDAVAPVCSEIAQIYVALDNCLNESFADTAQRDYLVLRAKEIGLEPKKATNTILKGEFQGNINIGDKFALDDLRYTVILCQLCLLLLLQRVKMRKTQRVSEPDILKI